MSTPTIVVIGNANVDLTTYVDSVPEEGETVLGHDFTIGMGGKGANQAVAASRAGGNVSFIGRIGQDTFGDFVWEHLHNEGLSLERFERIPGKSGIASIYVDSRGSNRIAVYPGASGTIDSVVASEGVLAHQSPRFVVSQLEISQEAVLGALKAGKQRGATTVLNTAPYAPLLPGMIENTDWLIANEIEMEDIVATEGLPSPSAFTSIAEVAPYLSGWSTRLGCNLVVTLGGEGAIGCEVGGEPYSFSPPPVTAIDTVGAGDCFVGFFVAFLDQGLTWPEALTGGVLAASESVQRAGAQSSYPSQSDAERLRAEAKATA